MALHADLRAPKSCGIGGNSALAVDLGLGSPTRRGETRTAADWRNQNAAPRWKAGRKARQGHRGWGQILADLGGPPRSRGVRCAACSPARCSNGRIPAAPPSGRGSTQAEAERGAARFRVLRAGRKRMDQRPRIVIGFDTSSSIRRADARLFTSEPRRSHAAIRGARASAAFDETRCSWRTRPRSKVCTACAMPAFPHRGGDGFRRSFCQGRENTALHRRHPHRSRCRATAPRRRPGALGVPQPGVHPRLRHRSHPRRCLTLLPPRRADGRGFRLAGPIGRDPRAPCSRRQGTRRGCDRRPFSPTTDRGRVEISVRRINGKTECRRRASLHPDHPGLRVRPPRTKGSFARPMRAVPQFGDSRFGHGPRITA